MARIEEQDKKKNQRIVIIIAFAILFVAIIIGLIFLLLWLDKKGKEIPPSGEDNTPTDVIEDKSTEYNRLLQLVNSEATELSYTPATEVISFTSDNEYFYITACNDTKIYNYSIDRTSISSDPLEYFLKHDVTSSMTEVLDSYNKGDISSEFTSKYLTSDNISNHSVSYTGGSKTYITSTIYNSVNKKVSVIYKVDIDTVLDNSYLPIEIDNTNQTLYSLYRYIATR
ncbi:MAG: hypothetical protein J5666_05595 [Bacilli bacterium]|nr:hypothetical protein [Bacilli bacterium]